MGLERGLPAQPEDLGLVPGQPRQGDVPLSGPRLGHGLGLGAKSIVLRSTFPQALKSAHQPSTKPPSSAGQPACVVCLMDTEFRIRSDVGCKDWEWTVGGVTEMPL